MVLGDESAAKRTVELEGRLMSDRIPGFREIEGRIADLEEDTRDKTTLTMVVLTASVAISVWLDLRAHLRDHEKQTGHVD
jgi:hypothetical protein